MSHYDNQQQPWNITVRFIVSRPRVFSKKFKSQETNNRKKTVFFNYMEKSKSWKNWIWKKSYIHFSGKKIHMQFFLWKLFSNIKFPVYTN